jgi:hypothetical protein
MIVIFTLAQNTATTSSAQLRLTLMTWFLPRRASGLVKAPPAIFSLPSIATLGAANAVVLVDPDNLAAHTRGDLAQLALLVGRRLVDSGNAKVENRAAHSLALPNLRNRAYCCL